MYGRLACPLKGENLKFAAAYKQPDCNCYVQAEFFDHKLDPLGSYNITPGSKINVIVSSKHEEFQDFDFTERVIIPMRYGIIPAWAKNQEEFLTKYHAAHLCRIEAIEESKLYFPLLQKGQRCVIPCIGFYESNQRSRQQYFFYNKNNSKSVLQNTKGTFNSKNGWSGVKLLYLAGIYSAHKDNKGQMKYYTAIITKEPGKKWNWFNYRMPVVLQNDIDVQIWINSKSYPLQTAFNVLYNDIDNIDGYPVNKDVIKNINNTSAICIERLNPEIDVTVPKNETQDETKKKLDSKIKRKRCNCLESHHTKRSKEL